jgi:hypothetical protein
MIVIVTRDDLRDEFTMADEAFALSPISARAALPSEQDYDAISEAFMETSRGRWFLGEYAKRNRNADTRMVLDAVARIEQNLAAQRQPVAENDGLAEALAAIRGAVEEARAAASAALDSLALEENLAPIRKGVRVIREIAWRLREIGADGRICDLIDSQVGVIEGVYGKISSTDPRAALSAAFELIEERIAGFGGSDAAAPLRAEEASASPSPSYAAGASDEMPAAAADEMQATDIAEAATSTPAMPTEAVAATAQAGDETVEAAEVAAEAADAYDDTLLDMVALEMAAPDPADIDDAFDTGSNEIHAAESPLADPIIAAQEPEPIAAPVQPPATQPSLQVSLGSTLIASGIVRRPTSSVSDPLAPIRRMSQAEKIAFFS